MLDVVKGCLPRALEVRVTYLNLLKYPSMKVDAWLAPWQVHTCAKVARAEVVVIATIVTRGARGHC
jgi:hypothetical protein